MTERPTVHLTNWASRSLHHGRRWTIMAKPRAWEHGEGKVVALIPDRADLDAVRHGAITWDVYRERFDAGMVRFVDQLAPGVLAATARDAGRALVQDGDTLCCGCARGKPCHRIWSAAWLHRAGWDVILDGVPFTP